MIIGLVQPLLYLRCSRRCSSRSPNRGLSARRRLAGVRAGPADPARHVRRHVRRLRHHRRDALRRDRAHAGHAGEPVAMLLGRALRDMFVLLSRRPVVLSRSVRPARALGRALIASGWSPCSAWPPSLSTPSAWAQERGRLAPLFNTVVAADPAALGHAAADDARAGLAAARSRTSTRSSTSSMRARRVPRALRRPSLVDRPRLCAAAARGVRPVGRESHVPARVGVDLQERRSGCAPRHTCGVSPP